MFSLGCAPVNLPYQFALADAFTICDNYHCSLMGPTDPNRFRTPNTAWKVRLPDTDDFKPVDLVRHPDQVPVPPATPTLPSQERGVRPARAIPYTLHADGHASPASFSIEFRSTGRATGVFQVRSADSTQEPRSYTVEPGKQLTDTWDSASGHDLSVYGPNGFFRISSTGTPATSRTASPASATRAWAA